MAFLLLVCPQKLNRVVLQTDLSVYVRVRTARTVKNQTFLSWGGVGVNVKKRVKKKLFHPFSERTRTNRSFPTQKLNPWVVFASLCVFRNDVGRDKYGPAVVDVARNVTPDAEHSG